MDTEQRFVAHGLVERDGRYLLLRRRDGRYLGGQWDIPGGTVEPSETPADAAVRECLEETGLGAEVVRELTRFENRDTEGRDIVFHTVTFELRLLDDDAPVTLSAEEHDSYVWRAPQKVDDLPLVWHVARTFRWLRSERSERLETTCGRGLGGPENVGGVF